MKKTIFKRLTSLATALALLGGMCYFMPDVSDSIIEAQADTYFETDVMYTEVLNSSYQMSFAAENDSVDIYDSQYDEIVAAIKENLVEHNSTFTVSSKLNELPSSLNNIANLLFYRAVEHTGVQNEGDYLGNNWGSYSCKLSTSSSTKTLTVTYVMTYATTKEQEIELDNKINEILDFLQLDGKNDYEKAFSIYDYVCSNTYYADAAGRDNDFSIEHTAYNALCKHTAVCQGYSSAIYRLMLSAGVDCRIISGIGNGGPHGWNIVRIGDKYYLLDSTWDAENLEYQWFLKSETDFPDHTPLDKYTTESFVTEYPLANTSFDNCEAVTDTLNGYIYKKGIDYLVILSYNGNEKEIVIPDEIDGTPVKRIASTAFCFSDAQSVVIPQGVQSIGVYAFYDCDKLTSITIPESVTSIAYDAFIYCDNLTDVYYTGSEEDWNAIDIDTGNGTLINATIHYDYGKPTVVPGDITGDGEVNLGDIVRLQKYINGWDVEINSDAADVTGDGVVDMKDIIRLQKYINGWDVELQ